MHTEKEVRARVAALIRAQYKARGIRRGEFAKQLGITDRMVGYWVDGTSVPKADLQERIETMFGWPPRSIAKALGDGLSGTPLEEIRIESAKETPAEPSPGDGLLEKLPTAALVDELMARRPTATFASDLLAKLPTAALTDELLARVHAAEDEARSLRRQLVERR